MPATRSPALSHLAAVPSVTDRIHVILLGIIEGITEFLPIPSTGHLLIAEKFGLGARADLFNIGIQAGAILAVTLIYWRRILQLLIQWRDPANRSADRRVGHGCVSPCQTRW